MVTDEDAMAARSSARLRSRAQKPVRPPPPRPQSIAAMLRSRPHATHHLRYSIGFGLAVGIRAAFGRRAVAGTPGSLASRRESHPPETRPPHHLSPQPRPTHPQLLP